MSEDRLALAMSDEDFKEHTVKKVLDYGDHAFIELDSGWTVQTSVAEGVTLPKPGDLVRVWPSGMFGVRGVALVSHDPVILYGYRTPEEQEADRKDHIQEQHRRREAQFTEMEAELRERIAKLPELLRIRIEDFEKCGGRAWMVNNCAYEVFVSESTVALLEAVERLNMSLEEFHALPSKEQDEKAPAVKVKEHSGNTMANAFLLARVWKEKKELIPYTHASLHRIMGCEECCCWAARDKSTRRPLPDADVTQQA